VKGKPIPTSLPGGIKMEKLRELFRDIVTGSVLRSIVVFLALLFIYNVPASRKYYNDIQFVGVDLIVTSKKLFNAVDNKDKLAIIKRYQDLKEACTEAIEEVEDMGGFKGDTWLQEKTLALLNLYDEFVKNELGEIVSTYIDTDGTPSYDDYVYFAQVLADFEDRAQVVVAEFNSAEVQFRAKHKITLLIKPGFKSLAMLLGILLMLWVLPVTLIGKFMDTDQHGFFFTALPAVVVAVAAGHFVSILFGYPDFMQLDLTIGLKVLLAGFVFQFFMETSYVKGLATAVLFWSCVFISMRYIYM
jgi:hypothetical protein